MLGVTSNRVFAGEFIAALGSCEYNHEEHCVYVGQHLSFCKQSPHPHFSLKAKDKRYLPAASEEDKSLE